MFEEMFQAIMYTIKNAWKTEKRIVLLFFMQGLFELVVTYLLILLPSAVIDEILKESRLDVIIGKTIIICFVFLIAKSSSEFINSSKSTLLTNNKMYYLRKIFEVRMKLDYQNAESELGQNEFQEVQTILFNDNTGISGTLLNFGKFIEHLMCFVLLFSIISQMSVVVVISVTITSLLSICVQRKVDNYMFRMRDKTVPLDRKITYINHSVSDYNKNKDIKLYSMQDWLSRIYEELIHDKINCVNQINKSLLFQELVEVVLFFLRNSIAYIYIFILLSKGRLAPHDFVFYWGCISGFSSYILGLVKFVTKLQSSSKDAIIVKNYIESHHIIENNSDFNESFSDTKITVRFDHVFFRYTKEGPDILKDITFELISGEKIALVGENGAGKSTLIKILCGLYQPTSGSIFINGINSSDLSPSEIYSFFSVVFQNIRILPFSIGQNVSMHDESHTCRKAVVKCLQDAGLQELITRIDDNLTKIIDPNGIELSGGEKQRLALARALYKDSPCLLLDEPTSNLDPIAESKLYKSYFDLSRGKSSVFVSHRLASTQFCDKIMFLVKGQITEKGTHEELMCLKGGYYDLYNIQSQYYKKDV